MSGAASWGPDRPEVLVIGAGPAGLAAAATLGAYGIGVLLVDLRTSPSALPRATGLGTRSTELFRSWGLEPALHAAAVDADLWLWESRTLAEVADGRRHAVGYPSRDQASVISPCAPTVVPQDGVEDVLRRHVEQLASVRVERGCEVLELRPHPGHVQVLVRTRSGEVRSATARYVLAADGAHSGIRAQIGIGTTRHQEEYGGVQAVLHAPLWDHLGQHRYALYSVTTAAAPGLFLPAGPGDRWVYGPGLPMDHPGHPGDDPRLLADAVRQGAGDPRLDLSIERIGAFRSPGEIAHRFRRGRTFLVGDAAHRVTPRGGTGMNSAILGGFDLGWKLSWVLRGWANPRLLDTYEEERRPVVEHHLARSLDPDGSRRPVAGELHLDLGGRIAHAWLPSGKRSTVDLVGPGWTLFTGPDPTPWASATSPAGAPLVVRPLDSTTARAVGVRGTGAVLTRPDGVPVALWSSARGAADVAGSVERFAGPLAMSAAA
jgi:putative polyketide hydroxylase